MKILIPAYDLSYISHVIKEVLNGHCAIVNVHDGPGKLKDREWAQAIGRMKEGKIFGYIDMAIFDKKGKLKGYKPVEEMEREAKVWKDFYGVTAFFYDDYKKPEGALPNAKGSIANPGFPVETVCGTTMSWETVKFVSKFAPVSKKPQTVLSMGCDSFEQARESLNFAAKFSFMKMFYAVPGGDTWAAYDRLPEYFHELCSEIKRLA